jgi:hypothetical protein
VESGVGAYPGSFDPPTVAHLAVAEAAWRQGGLAEVHLVVSRQPLGKGPTVPSLQDRVAVLEEIAGTRPWLAVRVTDRRLIADVAEGYDAVVMGVDKWLQVIDEAWYEGSVVARDAAVASLPRVMLAHRHLARPGAGLASGGGPPGPGGSGPAGPGLTPGDGPLGLTGPGYFLPGAALPEGGLVLDLEEQVVAVSSTGVRAGRLEWMAPEAARFDAATGAWSDPAPYQEWSQRSPGPRV